MGEWCERCDKPVATEADWEATPEGVGEQLCWGSCASVDWRARALAAETERDALRVIVDRTRELVAASRHTDDCAASHHEHCTAEECDYDDLTPEECLRAWREDCECGVKTLASALGMEVSRG